MLGRRTRLRSGCASAAVAAATSATAAASTCACIAATAATAPAAAPTPSGVLLCISAYRRERALGLRTCNICQYLQNAALRESLPYRRLALSVVAR